MRKLSTVARRCMDVEEGRVGRGGGSGPRGNVFWGDEVQGPWGGRKRWKLVVSESSGGEE